MVYSEHLDGVFCISCTLFCTNRGNKGASVNLPFTNWRKKSEKCEQHEKADYHNQAMEIADSFARTVETLSSTVPVMIIAP